MKLTNYTQIKYLGLLQNDDFKRIYDSKKLIQNQLNEKLLRLKKSNYFIQKQSSIISNIITKFDSEFEITKKYLSYFIEKIEIDSSKKIYIYCKFHKL